MTLDDLIEWVDERMERLPRDREARDRAKHVRRLYPMLHPRVRLELSAFICVICG
jgi:hypothetical protein